MSTSIQVSPYITIYTRILPSGKVRAATECGRSITIGNDGSRTADRHRDAALALIEKLGLNVGHLIGGTLPDKPMECLFVQVCS